MIIVKGCRIQSKGCGFLHHLLGLILAFILALACGIATAIFFSKLRHETVQWDWRLAWNKYFWIGILIGLLFLYYDNHFEHINSLTRLL